MMTPAERVIAEHATPHMPKPAHNMFAREITKALDAAGYVIVPKDPNPTMIADGGVAFENAMFGECKLVFDGAEDCYRAMIAVAP